jgi:tetratricopeptide (TPR) repeat protein
MFQCARPACKENAKSSCSGCGREHYCSGDCQKLDWKAHKSICLTLKKLSSKLQPFEDAFLIVKEMMSSTKGKDLRVLNHLYSYAEHQFGNQVLGTMHRDRGDGQRINNWIADILILHDITCSIIEIYVTDKTIGDITVGNRVFPYLEKSISLLSPWLIYVDSDPSDPMEKLSTEQKNYVITEMHRAERRLTAHFIHENLYDLADGHCHQCLKYSRRLGVDEKEKITAILAAFRLFVQLRQRQCNYPGATKFAEEAYILVSEAYDPVHTQVQEAAGVLINCLIHEGNLETAETYAQQTYDNLRDKKNGLNQESEDVAGGAHNLAHVLYQKSGDMIKAEKIAREVMRIRGQLHKHDHYLLGDSGILLARILESQGKLGNETRELYERSLVIFVRHGGVDGLNTATGNTSIGDFYQQRAIESKTPASRKIELLKAQGYYKEALRIYNKIYGPHNSYTTETVSALRAIAFELSRV